MSSDKILQQFKFQNGIDQFSDTSPTTYPVGNPRRLFFSDTHNGVSGYPLDNFMDNNPLPVTGDWTLDYASFINESSNVLKTIPDMETYPYIEGIKIFPNRE